MTGQVIQCFLDADLRCGHEGLAKIAKKDGIQVNGLLPGRWVIYINTKKDKMKLYAANQVVAYIRPEKGKIDLNTVRHIPQVFLSTGRINYEEALRIRLEKELKPSGEKRIRKVE